MAISLWQGTFLHAFTCWCRTLLVLCKYQTIKRIDFKQHMNCMMVSEASQNFPYPVLSQPPKFPDLNCAFRAVSSQLPLDDFISLSHQVSYKPQKDCGRYNIILCFFFQENSARNQITIFCLKFVVPEDESYIRCSTQAFLPWIFLESWLLRGHTYCRTDKFPCLKEWSQLLCLAPFLAGLLNWL